MNVSEVILAVIMTAVFAVIGFIMVQVINMREMQLQNTKYVSFVDMLIEAHDDHEARLRVVEGCGGPCD